VRNVLGLTRSVPAGHFRRYLDVATRAFLDLQRREGGQEQDAEEAAPPTTNVSRARRVGLDMVLHGLSNVLHTVNIGSTAMHVDKNQYEAMTIGKVTYERMGDCMQAVLKRLGPSAIAHLLNFQTSSVLARSARGNTAGFRKAQGLPKKPTFGSLQEALSSLCPQTHAGSASAYCACAHCQRPGAATAADVHDLTGVLEELAEEERHTTARFQRRASASAKRGGLSDTVLLNARIRLHHDGHTISVLSLGGKGPEGARGAAPLGGMHGVVEPGAPVWEGLEGEIRNLAGGGVTSATPLHADRTQLRNILRLRGGGAGSGSNNNTPAE